MLREKLNFANISKFKLNVQRMNDEKLLHGIMDGVGGWGQLPTAQLLGRRETALCDRCRQGRGGMLDAKGLKPWGWAAALVAVPLALLQDACHVGVCDGGHVQHQERRKPQRKVPLFGLVPEELLPITRLYALSASASSS